MTKRKTVNIATLAFLEEDTFIPGIGGLQRWSRDIAQLLVDRNWEVVIYQKTSREFSVRYAEHIQVIGIKAPPSFYGNILFSRNLSKVVASFDPMLFISQELMLGSDWSGSLSVNHGIWWDSDFPLIKKLVNKWVQKKIVKDSHIVVCVDTNYINWCHAEIPGRFDWREKMRYLPNYADTEAFRYRPDNALNQGPFKIFCPRRLPDILPENWDGRGAKLLLEALAILQRSGFPFLAEFAGSGKAKSDVIAYAERHGFSDKVVCTQYQLDEISVAYSASDIVVIPTASHEGTSLAAVEAMCSGCATVVTHIGGLPNLVIDGLNGFMSDLSPQALADAIVRASKSCRDPHWRKASANLSDQAFGKAAWEAKLLKCLAAVLEDGDR
jgi:glycosyltransferase involved in cell wall biosynthesis